MKKMVGASVLLLILTMSLPSQSRELRFGINDAIYNSFPEAVAAIIELLEKKGFEIALEIQPSLRATNSIEQNELDGELMRVDSYKEYVPGAVRIDPPYIFVSVSAIVSSGIGIDSIADLKGKTMGAPRGWFITEEYRNFLEAGDVYLVDNVSSLFQSLVWERCDFVYFPSHRSANIIESLKLEDKLIILPEPFATEKLYLWVTRENSDLADELSRILSEAIESGEFEPFEY